MRRAPAWEPSLNREPLGHPHTWVRTGLGRRAGVGTRLNATTPIWSPSGEESMNPAPVAAIGSHSAWDGEADLLKLDRSALRRAVRGLSDVGPMDAWRRNDQPAKGYPDAQSSMSWSISTPPPVRYPRTVHEKVVCPAGGCSGSSE